MRTQIVEIDGSRLESLRKALGHHVRQQEASYSKDLRAPDTLMGHLERVASHAVCLAEDEGVDLLCAELAGLFHDAGKFHGGQYHQGDKPEEEDSVAVLRSLVNEQGLDPKIIDAVGDAIRRLYREDSEQTPLSKVLFDADNLDKLGFVGVANYFIKSGLRGQSISADMIAQLTVELTYARYASRRLFTKLGRAMAERRSADTIRFIHGLLSSLKEDGLFDARIEHAEISDVELDVVTPSFCNCGANMTKRTWMEQGLKCMEIHIEMACPSCDGKHEIKFCRPLFAE